MTPTQSPTNPHAAGKAAHLSVALRNLAVNSLDRDTQNHLHALANDAYELSNSHAALVEALDLFLSYDMQQGTYDALRLNPAGQDGMTPEQMLYLDAVDAARAAIARATGQGGGE